MRYHYEGPWPFPAPEPAQPSFLHRNGRALAIGAALLVLFASAGVWIATAGPLTGPASETEASGGVLDDAGGAGGLTEPEADLAAAGLEGGTSSLRVTSVPEGASVMLDHVFVGTTPVWLHDLPSGSRMVSVVSDNAPPIDSTVTLAPHQTTTLTLSPRLASRPRAERPARSVPPPPVALPAERPTSAPRPSVEPEAPRASAAPPSSTPRLPVTAYPPPETPPAPRPAPPVRETPPAEQTAPAPPRAGTLSVVVRPWGTIAVDGTTRARETDVRYETELPPGRHTVRAEHPVLGSREVEVLVRPGRTARVEIDLNDD